MASASFFGPFSPTMARIPQLRPVPVRQRSIIKVDENDEKIALRRMVAGRGILRNHGRNNNSPETDPETPDDTSWFGNWLALTNAVEMFRRFDRRAGFRARLSPAGRAKASAIFPGLQSSRVQDFRHRSSRTLCDSGQSHCSLPLPSTSSSCAEPT